MTIASLAVYLPIHVTLSSIHPSIHASYILAVDSNVHPRPIPFPSLHHARETSSRRRPQAADPGLVRARVPPFRRLARIHTSSMSPDCRSITRSPPSRPHVAVRAGIWCIPATSPLRWEYRSVCVILDVQTSDTASRACVVHSGPERKEREQGNLLS